MNRRPIWLGLALTAITVPGGWARSEAPAIVLGQPLRHSGAMAVKRTRHRPRFFFGPEHSLVAARSCGDQDLNKEQPPARTSSKPMCRKRNDLIRTESKK